MTDNTASETVAQATRDDLAPTADNSSSQTLRAINILEENLREKRSRIEEIEKRRDILVAEYRQLSRALESESSDLAQKLHAVISDLNTTDEDSELLLGLSVATTATQLDKEIADGDQPVPASPDNKHGKPGSIEYLQEKERRRWGR